MARGVEREMERECKKCSKDRERGDRHRDRDNEIRTTAVERER